MATREDYFDRRGASYDRDAVHHRIVSFLMNGLDLLQGSTVLDIATGTGMAALEAAPRVGPAGNVIGIDVSEGMLRQARHKAIAAGLSNVQFMHSGAERLDLPAAQFDFVVCASALVLMSDVAGALRHWVTFLKAGGVLAFETPAKPFGLSQRAVEVAARRGIHLAYGEVADTQGKCQVLLSGAGLEVLSVRTEFADTATVPVQAALEFWDQRVDHPAWAPIKDATASERQVMRDDFNSKRRSGCY